MPALSSLKLVAAKKPAQLPPAVQRRNKLIERISEQIVFATAQQEGKLYAPTQTHRTKDKETGEIKTLVIPKRVKEWWFESDTGKLCVSIKFGSKIVEIAKGKTAVELTNASELLPTLEILKQAVVNGELDAQIDALRGTVKAAKK